MNENINLCEILKNCPKGMGLNCTIWDNVEFDHIDMKSNYPIYIKKSSGEMECLTENGCFNFDLGAKCVIFPKGKTTWEGFIPPCKFNAGDVIVSEHGNIVLFSHIDSKDIVHYHCIISTYGSFRIEENTNIGVGRYYDCVLANEQQKQRMYDRIKCSGYKYDQSINKLEKINLKFKIGDIIWDKDSYKVKITNVSIEDRFYTYESLIAKGIGTITFNDQDDWELIPDDIKPKFKIGDRIKHRLTGEICIVLFVQSDGDGGGVYDVAITNEIGKSIDVKDQDDWELVEYRVGDHFIDPKNNNVFVITKIEDNGNYSVESLGEIYYPFEMKKLDVDKCTKINKWNPKWFKPFDKVLIRYISDPEWLVGLFSHLNSSNTGYRYSTISGGCNYCIPYNKETEHLIGTTLEEPEFYKL